MELTTHELTVRAIHDALALAGPADGCGGFVRTSNAEDYMGGERLRLAREVAKALPPGTTAATAEDAAIKLVPLIRALLAR